ncbi:hypothetical protein LOTGIDRAFT_170043 [Lottia gigantea]|uniref:Uncharacterized protein n=1 Tax=Lottia gigantea TaxID=225164 RepID=V3ZJ90_LOTGI|nr:hypothetical protein LOTGIDRAFT_170043 [Lottia gigantea]ESO82415.1 hypothetical protein LOTGIDRAFT_170043 [Lottia gigantea]
MEPPPPSYNDAVTDQHRNSVNPLRDEVHEAENSQFDEDAESKKLLESVDATQININNSETTLHNVGESHLGTSGSSYSSGESQLRASGSPHVSGPLLQTTGYQYRTNGHPSGSGATPQTAEPHSRTTENPYYSRTPLHTEESEFRTTGSSSGAPSKIAGTTETREVHSTPLQQPNLSEYSAQTQPPLPSYDAAFMRPDQARNNMQISRNALSGAHRDPLLEPEQPPPSYSAVMSSQGSRYYPPVNAGILNSSYATKASTSEAGINRYPAESTYGSGAQGSIDYQGYQRMAHGSYAPVISNTGTSVPNTTPQQKTRICRTLCSLCVCINMIFIPVIIFLL